VTNPGSTYRQNERAARTAIRGGSYLAHGVRGPTRTSITQRTGIHERYMQEYSG
jgi:hypothetical protein